MSYDTHYKIWETLLIQRAALVCVFSLWLTTSGVADSNTTPLSESAYDDVMIAVMGVDGSEPAILLDGKKYKAVRKSFDTIIDPGSPNTPIQFSEPLPCIFEANVPGMGVVSLDATKGLDWQFTQTSQSAYGKGWQAFTAASTVVDMVLRTPNGDDVVMSPRPLNIYGDVVRFKSAIKRLQARCAKS